MTDEFVLALLWILLGIGTAVTCAAVLMVGWWMDRDSNPWRKP